VKGRILSIAGGFLLGALTMLVGLAQAGKLAPSRPDALVALAQTVEVEHRRVDLLLERGDVTAAIALLEELRKQPWLSRDEGGDVAVELRHDVYGRLVRLRLDYPEIDPLSHDALLQIVAEGLGTDYHDIDTNPFTARLVALRGEIFETLDRDDDALGAYEEALDMNRTLLERELGGEP
jgi:hypothetical protein